MPHLIQDARWTPKVNMLIVTCPQGGTFETRSDRFRVSCPICGKVGQITTLRDRWAAGERPGGNVAPA